MTALPSVDVNMMVYNSVDTVGAAIDCVLAQTWPAVTLTLFDNWLDRWHGAGAAGLCHAASHDPHQAATAATPARSPTSSAHSGSATPTTSCRKPAMT